MKNKRKALLLSALILPGMGQFFLRRYKSAVTLTLIVAVSLYRFASIVMQHADAAVSRLMQQGGALDMQAIHQAASQSASADGAYGIYLWIIFICWLISLLDIVFVKHNADKQV